MFPMYLKRQPDDPMPDDPIAYVVGKGGAFLQKRSVVFRAVVPARSLPMLAEVRTEAEYLLPPIPPVEVARMLTFFRREYRRHGGEAILLVAYDAERGAFHLVAPPQQVSAARLRYDMPLQAPDGATFVGTIHSHGSFGAGHSCVDQKDEETFDGIHVTIGDLGLPRTVSAVASLVVSGHRYPQDPVRVLGGMRKVEAAWVATIPPAPATAPRSGFDTIIDRHAAPHVARRRFPRRGYVAPRIEQRWVPEGYTLYLSKGTDVAACVPDSSWPEQVRLFRDEYDGAAHATYTPPSPYVPYVPTAVATGWSPSALDGRSQPVVPQDAWEIAPDPKAWGFPRIPGAAGAGEEEEVR